MRNHIGKHILQQKIESDPHLCGFCGNIGCSINLESSSGFGKNKTIAVKSDCPYFYKFSENRSLKLRKANPCLNRPIQCEHCHEVVWSYNMNEHFKISHKGFECPALISEEEKKLVLNF